MKLVFPKLARQVMRFPVQCPASFTLVIFLIDALCFSPFNVWQRNRITLKNYNIFLRSSDVILPALCVELSKVSYFDTILIVLCQNVCFRNVCISFMKLGKFGNSRPCWLTIIRMWRHRELNNWLQTQSQYFGLPP